MTSRRRPAPGGGPVELDLFDLPASESATPRTKAEPGSRRGGAPRTESRVEPRADGPQPAPDTFVSSAEAAVADALDAIPGGSPRSAVSVVTLTRTTKDVLEGAFAPLWVRGEVSDFKQHRNGHWYFCLRDADAQIRCVVWSRDRRGIPAAPDEGMQVAAFGQLTVYTARGDLQFTVSRIEAEGDGLWRKALEQTRRRLEADGLLDPMRKRALPAHPGRIAVVTSPDGAALHDIVAVLRRRAPHVEIVVVPAAVQGEAAPESICRAFDRIARWGDADLVIVGRGGGAREDLWAFNDERVARAVAACAIPTISAVGHEVDFTICDLVADLRAATPSAAAEAAAPARADTVARLKRLAGELSFLCRARLDDAGSRATSLAEQVAASAVRLVRLKRMRIEATAGRLHALSPLATLARGYAVARGEDGRSLDARSIVPGDRLELLFRDGTVRATANEVHPNPQPPEAGA